MSRLVAISILSLAVAARASEPPRFEAEQIFAPNMVQTHAPGIVECPDGSLLASWYSDTPRDSAIFGARRAKGARAWSEPFVLADTPDFPDCNTTMMVDRSARLWLFWPVVVGSSWESCLLKARVASDYVRPGPPRWDRDATILLRPDDFKADALKLLGDRKLKPPRGAFGNAEAQRDKLGDPLYQRLGWAPRCKPTILPGGRIVLPLYTDTFAISIMALSDDGGETWHASKPLIGFGNIQPTVLRRSDGTLVAYMRENGDRERIRISESKDDGMTWGPVGETALPNPGSGIDGVRLWNGHWLLVFNDSSKSRATLAVSISEDEGRTWPFTRHLERHRAGNYHYPAVIQGADGTIHAIYSCFIAADAEESKPGTTPARPKIVAKGIKHAAFDEAWVRAGD